MAKDFRSRLIPVESSISVKPDFKSRLIPVGDTPEEETVRTGSQVIQGRAEMTPAGLAGEATRFIGTGEALAELDYLEENLPRLKKLFPQLDWPEKIDREKYMEALQTASEYDPFTVSGLAKIAEDTTGAPLSPKTKLQKSIRFASGASRLKSGSLSEQAKYGAKATIGKEALQAAGVPEPIAEIGGLFVGEFKAPKVSLKKETLPSGLTKPSAVEAKFPKLGTLSKERQAASIENLNKEASKLTKSIVEKRLPIAKQLEEGFDFEGKFAKDFGEVEKLAQKSNPEIDITPITKLFAEKRRQYSGIPNLHQEGKRVMAEVKSFGDRPQTGMRNLLKIYRSNNQKKKQIYETAHLTGRQKEYVNFLDDYNRTIASSFRETLPKDSAWMKLFENSNKEFKNFMDAKKALNQVKGLLSEKPTKVEIANLIRNPKKQQQLALSMGEVGSKEVIQIAKDLEKATEAIKKIPIKTLSKFDQVFPLYFLIPWVGKYLGIYKGLQAGRYGYGWLLSTPKRRIAYEKSLKSIINNDLESYKKFTSVLLKERESE